MLRVNRKSFFDEYKRRISGKISPRAVAALDQLLDFIERDPYVNHIPDASYMLSTVDWETGHTYEPVRERGGDARAERMYGYLTPRGRRLGNDAPGEGSAYDGKGYPQLTGEDNYEWAEAMLRKRYPDLIARFEARTGKTFDLTIGDQPGDARDPFNAMDAEISYAILSEGMRVGQFGRPMVNYTRQSPPDYFNARRSVNGGDHKSYRPIADTAEKFEACLRIALSAATPIGLTSSAPAPTTAAAVVRLSDQAADAGISLPGGELPAAAGVVANKVEEVNITAPVTPVVGGGPHDPAIQVTEPIATKPIEEPLSERWYGLAKSVPAKVYGIATAGGTLTIAGLSEAIGFARTNSGLVLTCVVAFGLILAGLYLMHMRHVYKMKLTDQQADAESKRLAAEAELNKLRLLIASNPGLINVK